MEYSGTWAQKKTKKKKVFLFYSFNAVSWDICYAASGAGTGFSVLVTVREANLAPLYAPADHSLSNDNSYFRGDTLIVQRYCPYPVPEKYQLSVTLHHVSRSQITSIRVWLRCFFVQELVVDVAASRRHAALSCAPRFAIIRSKFSGSRLVSTVLNHDCLGNVGLYILAAGGSAMQICRTRYWLKHFGAHDDADSWTTAQ